MEPTCAPAGASAHELGRIPGSTSQGPNACGLEPCGREPFCPEPCEDSNGATAVSGVLVDLGPPEPRYVFADAFFNLQARFIAEQAPSFAQIGVCEWHILRARWLVI